MRRWLAAMTPTTGRVYVLTIAPTTEAMDRHSPGLAASIAQYNGLIARAARDAGSAVVLVDVHGLILGDAAGVLVHINEDDGHHLTAAGHALIADAILARERRQS
jgi:lysophospholipase L1-like esterase